MQGSINYLTLDFLLPRMPPSHKPEKKRATLTTISSTIDLKSNSNKFNRANGDHELKRQEDEALKSKDVIGAESSKGEEQGSSQSKVKKTASSKHILKLEQALKKCSDEIKRLEEAEIDWDDEVRVGHRDRFNQ